MFKTFLKFALLLGLVAPLAAQTLTYPAESTNNTFTGTNAFQGNVYLPSLTQNLCLTTTTAGLITTTQCGGVTASNSFSPGYYQGTQGGTSTALSAGAGPLNVVGLTNNGTINTPTDNGTLITNAQTTGANVILPNNASLQAGAIQFANTILMPHTGSTLQGTGGAQFAPSDTPEGLTLLNYTGTTGDGIDSICPTNNCGGITIGNLNLQATGNSTGTAINLNCGTPTSSCNNGTYIHDVWVQGFECALCTISQGNWAVERAAFTGTPATGAGGATAVGTGSFSGGTMTLTAVSSGVFKAGQQVGGAGVTPGTTIILPAAGGGAGAYSILPAQTVAGPITITQTQTGYAVDIGGGHGLNSVRFRDIKGACQLASDSPAVVSSCIGFMRVQAENGVYISGGDFIGNTILELGNQAAGLQVNGFWADLQHIETRRGPQYLVDSNGTGTVVFESGDGGLFLGPPIVANSAVYLNLIKNVSAPNNGPGFLSAVPSGSGGTLAANTYFFWIQAYDPVAPIVGSVTTFQAYTGAVGSGGQTISTSTGSVALTWPFVAGSSSTQYLIYENTTNSISTAQLIETSTSGVSGKTSGAYTVTGSETLVGTNPHVSTIPLFSKGNYQTQVSEEGGRPLPVAGQFAQYGELGLDSAGSFYNQTANIAEVPIAFAPTAGSSCPTNALGEFVEANYPPGTSTGTNTLLYGAGSYVGSTLNCVWQNLLTATFPVSVNLNDSTSSTQLFITQTGVGTNNALVSLEANNSNPSAFPLFLESSDTVGNKYLLKMQESWNVSGQAFGFTTSNFFLPYGQQIFNPVPAVNGTNRSSPILQMYGQAWNTGTSGPVQSGFTQQVIFDNTATTPKETFTLGTQPGGGLTPNFVVDFSAATGGAVMPNTTFTGSGSPNITIGTAGSATGTLTLESATATGGIILSPASASSAFTATIPANTGTVAETNLAQTWSGLQSFGSGLTTSGARKATFTCTSGGTITITNANILVTSDVPISLNTAGGTISTSPAMKSVTSGTGFTVLCATSDTSIYNYDILN